MSARNPGPARSRRSVATPAGGAARGGPRPPGPTITGVAPLGQIRRSQIISTYGIGAIVDLEHGSFMPMGLEDWESQTRAARQTSMVIYEARLQAQLDADKFLSAPVVEEIEGQRDRVDPRYAVPAVRFPRWHECPKCNRLGTENDPFEPDAEHRTLRCTACGGAKVNPVRFIVACSRGHIEDFPWVWWAHRNAPNGECNSPVLYLKSHGESASLADLYVQCRACKAPGKSLGDAFVSGVFGNRKCSGRRPWLWDREECSPDEKPRALQRGASNIHFPVVVSALSIPPVSEAAFQALDEHWSVFTSLGREALPAVLQPIAERLGVPLKVLLDAYEQRRAIEQGGPGYTEAGSRAEEYLALSTTVEEAAPVGGYVAQFQNAALSPPAGLQKWFDLVGAVSRLREVRALAAFSRIEPFPVSGDRVLDAIAKHEVAPLSKSHRRWFPAAEIRGEGIFLRFRTDAINGWIAGHPEISGRAAAIDAQAAKMALDRGYKQPYPITPRLLLVHSFAHAIIRQLSMDCGYSSSALRERLYVAEPGENADALNGVLIYTGSPDSEGSLGGLVRLADPSLIEDAVKRAMRSAKWCGSDPVCLETQPDVSGERISGAACHCCLLVPETACERYNRELDRTMLVGDAEARFPGFFAGLVED